MQNLSRVDNLVELASILSSQLVLVESLDEFHKIFREGKIFLLANENVQKSDNVFVVRIFEQCLSCDLLVLVSEHVELAGVLA